MQELVTVRSILGSRNRHQFFGRHQSLNTPSSGCTEDATSLGRLKKEPQERIHRALLDLRPSLPPSQGEHRDPEKIGKLLSGQTQCLTVLPDLPGAENTGL